MSYMADASGRHHLWELAVLAFLREKSMHPYEMQRLLVERHKDELLALKRGSLYHAINRLVKLELIAPVATARHGRRPERTTYRITAGGREALLKWIEEMISFPTQESSEFMAALSFLVHLTPKAAIPQLKTRMNWLEKNIAEIDAAVALVGPRVGRINMVESEYLSAVRKAELAWIRNLVSELQSGQFSWNIKTILREEAVPVKGTGTSSGKEK